MTRHYSIRAFFRQMPNALLARYFAARGVLADFDFARIKETKIEALFDAWTALPDKDKARMEGELREVWDMSCAPGYQAILDEADFHLNDEAQLAAFKDELMALPSHYDRAMTVYLDHPQLWLGAMRFQHADSLGHWRKRKNLPKVKAATEPADLEALAGAIRNYYQLTEARAKHCRVEAYLRGGRDYFFAFPEDYAQQSVEWDGDEFGIRPHHPAFEIVFVYHRADGRLDLNVDASRNVVEALQAMFAEHILKCDELPADPADNRIYRLGALKQRNFAFTWSPDSGIESVTVCKLRLGLFAPKNAKLIVDADMKHNPKAVYDLLDKLAPVLPSSAYMVTQIGITATVKANPKASSKTVSFTVSFPNSCSLKHDEVGLKLRAMLEASGIEPKEPDETGEAEAAPEPEALPSA